LYVLTQTVFQVSIETYENAAYRRVAKGFRNPRRVRDALLRISFLSLSIVALYPFVLVLLYPSVLVDVKLSIHLVLLTYSLILLTTVVLYLLACDPLPPCTGKLREWLRRASPSRLPVSDSPATTNDRRVTD
jgi:hypothetical protein